MIDHYVLHCSQDHLGTRMCDLDSPVFYHCRKHRQLAHQEGDLQCTFPLDVQMVHSSTLAVCTDGEHLMCGGFSLSEIIHFGILEFITDSLGGVSLSPRGTTQVPPSWVHHAVGHQPCCMP
jgi:hypothetical protein